MLTDLGKDNFIDWQPVRLVSFVLPAEERNFILNCYFYNRKFLVYNLNIDSFFPMT